IVSGPATISGNTVTITGAGTIVVGAAQAATGSYTAATAQVSLNVAPATPTLSFTSIPTQSYGNAPFSINASSASNGAMTYSVLSGPATISKQHRYHHRSWKSQPRGKSGSDSRLHRSQRSDQF